MAVEACTVSTTACVACEDRAEFLQPVKKITRKQPKKTTVIRECRFLAVASNKMQPNASNVPDQGAGIRRMEALSEPVRTSSIEFPEAARNAGANSHA